MKTNVNSTAERPEKQVDWDRRIAEVKELRYQLACEVIAMARRLLAGCLTMPPESVRLSDVIRLVGMANQLGADLVAMQPENNSTEHSLLQKELEEALHRAYSTPLPREVEAEATQAAEVIQAPTPETGANPMAEAEAMMPSLPGAISEPPSASQPSQNPDPSVINPQPSAINPQPTANTMTRKKPAQGTFARQEWARRKFGSHYPNH